jgi:nucleoside-specific outer membrane channel protein Tsx
MKEYTKYIVQNEGFSKGTWFDLYTYHDLDRAKETASIVEAHSGFKHRVLKRVITEEVV